MNIAAEQTTTITLTVTREEAERIMHDFDQRREPSGPGKQLYGTLALIVRRESDSIAAKFAKPVPADPRATAREDGGEGRG